jgi:hypothetical protein
VRIFSSSSIFVSVADFSIILESVYDATAVETSTRSEEFNRGIVFGTVVVPCSLS